MLGFLPPVVRGVIALTLLVINTLFWCALLLALALVKAPAVLLHGVGGGLAAGRVLHAIGLYQSSGASVGRMLGILLTWGALLAAAAGLLLFALAA